MLPWSGTPVKHNSSLCQLSYLILYPSVVIMDMGAQAEVPHCYILVFFHSFLRWERGVIRGIKRGIFPHQAENFPKTIEMRVLRVPEKECVCEQKSFVILSCTTHQFKIGKSKTNMFLYQFDFEMNLI